MFEKIIRFGDRKWVRIGNIAAGILAIILAAIMLVMLTGCGNPCDSGHGGVKWENGGRWYCNDGTSFMG
jgi:hypothetical protein